VSVADGVRFLKGHGTENDFVLLPDLTGELDLSADLVRRLCDRRAGIGADGVLRVVPTAADPEVAHLADRAEWFMDYRNADGSVAEMCGNGARVYARYLIDAGLAAPGRLTLATRHGLRKLVCEADGDVTVDMGAAAVDPEPAPIRVAGSTRSAVPVHLGNPHAVVLLAEPVAELDLREPPKLPADRFPTGANLEIVNVVGPGRLRMRVVERGVGETRSCGTGACAAAAAAGFGQPWEVDVPGGRLAIHWSGDSVLLRGPAVLVADGKLSPSWLVAR